MVASQEDLAFVVGRSMSDKSKSKIPERVTAPAELGEAILMCRTNTEIHRREA
jgi:hypothetical protein